MAFDHSARDEGASGGSLMSKICLSAGGSCCSKLAPTPKGREGEKNSPW